MDLNFLFTHEIQLLLLNGLVLNGLLDLLLDWLIVLIVLILVLLSLISDIRLLEVVGEQSNEEELLNQIFLEGGEFFVVVEIAPAV